MEQKQRIMEIVDKSGRGYFDQNLYIQRLYNALLPDDLMPELVERIGNFVWALQQIEIASGSSIDIGFNKLPEILKGDYTADGYKRRWRDIESKYHCKDWYLGMIAQVEAEEALKGRSEI